LKIQNFGAVRKIFKTFLENVRAKGEILGVKVLYRHCKFDYAILGWIELSLSFALTFFFFFLAIMM